MAQAAQPEFRFGKFQLFIDGLLVGSFDKFTPSCDARAGTAKSFDVVLREPIAVGQCVSGRLVGDVGHGRG